MKRHGHLFKKIITFENLLLAVKKASRGKRSKKAVAAFEFNLEHELITLREELESGLYKPRPYTQFEIREPKVRQICSSNFRDRIVHHAICNYVEPILEKRSIYDSYACRVNKGAHLAVVRCQRFSRKYKYYLKCDIRKFFETIDHEILKLQLRRVFKDPKLLSLMDKIIVHEVSGKQNAKGIPIGNLTSQHFANFYLSELDHFIKDKMRVRGYIRYMDDFIAFSDNKKELQNLLSAINDFVVVKLKLELKPSATIIAPVSEGIPFLGFRIFSNLIRIKRENLIRWKRKIRLKEKLYLEGTISEIHLTQSIQSIIGHISHVNSLGVRRKVFEDSLKLVW